MTAPVYSLPLDQATTALLELLRGTGRTVWDGAYGGDPTKPAYPYGILYALPGGSSDPFPDLGGRRLPVTLAFQVTAVSTVRNQCQATVRQFHDQVLARTAAGWVHDLPAPAGWECVDRTPDPVMPGVDRTGEPPRVVYSSPLRFALTYAPAQGVSP